MYYYLKGMLFSSMLLTLPGEPPSSLLGKLTAWYVLLGMIGALFLLNLATLEIIESLLSSLMFCLAWLIVRNQMQDAPKYVVIYSILCVLNFFFDAVPLIISFRGRSAVTVEPGYQTSYDGVEQATYTRTVLTTPFFDAALGFVYNTESVAMTLSPLTMLLGAVLSMWAQYDIQQAALSDEEGPVLAHLAGLRGDGDFAGERTPLRPGRAVHDLRPFVRFQGDIYGSGASTGMSATAFVMVAPTSDDSLADGDANQKNGSTVWDMQAVFFDGEAGEEPHRVLLREAQARAEQQEMARRTMLSLAGMLEEVTQQRRQLAKELDEERRAAALMKAGWTDMSGKLERLTEAHERSLAKDFVQKGMECGNRFMWSMMLEKSREGFPTKLFGDLAESIRRPKLKDLLAGDIVTFKWLIVGWKQEVAAGKRRRAAERDAADRARLEADIREQLQEEARRVLAEWKVRCTELERRLNEALHRLKEAESQNGQEQAEVQRVRSVYEEEKQQLMQAQEEISVELATVRRAVTMREVQIETLKKEVEVVGATAKSKEKEIEDDVQRLKDKIRKLTGEMEQAVILARHMRETALKVKRDASKSVSPEKFSQLVAQLEDLKDKLDVASQDNDHMRQDRCWLQDKLDRNQRRLELERQFLPLVHAARGPLGAKESPAKRDREDPAKRDKESFEERVSPARGGGGAERTLPASRSLPALAAGGNRGGVPLGAQMGSPLGGIH